MSRARTSLPTPGSPKISTSARGSAPAILATRASSATVLKTGEHRRSLVLLRASPIPVERLARKVGDPLGSKYRLNRTIPRGWMTLEMWTVTCCSSRRLVDHIMRSVYRWSGRQNVSWILGAVLLLLASQGWGQEAPSSAEKAQPPVAERAQPPVAAYPLELLGLLAPPEARGPLTLTPSISVSEEYNDNIFLDNRRRESDFITSFAPAVTLFVNSPSYRLTAGYSFGADLYARQDRLSNPLARQNFLADGMYKLTPELTLTAIESFAFNRSTNLLAPNTFS